jgi:hypothetical protein
VYSLLSPFLPDIQLIIEEEPYIAPKAEFLELWSKTGERQTVQLEPIAGNYLGVIGVVTSRLNRQSVRRHRLRENKQYLGALITFLSE